MPAVVAVGVVEIVASTVVATVDGDDVDRDVVVVPASAEDPEEPDGPEVGVADAEEDEEEEEPRDW